MHGRGVLRCHRRGDGRDDRSMGRIGRGIGGGRAREAARDHPARVEARCGGGRAGRDAGDRGSPSRRSDDERTGDHVAQALVALGEQDGPGRDGQAQRDPVDDPHDAADQLLGDARPGASRVDRRDAEQELADRLAGGALQQPLDGDEEDQDVDPRGDEAARGQDPGAFEAAAAGDLDAGLPGRDELTDLEERATRAVGVDRGARHREEDGDRHEPHEDDPIDDEGTEPAAGDLGGVDRGGWRVRGR